MEAQHLRIGNYVYDNYSGEMIVCGIVNDFYLDLKKSEKLPSGRYSIESIKPIPLTEQWLKEFGFKKSKENKHWFEWNDGYNFIVSIALDEMGNVVNLERGGMKEAVLIPLFVNDVHTLQNLIFSLTGKELERK